MVTIKIMTNKNNDYTLTKQLNILTLDVNGLHGLLNDNKRIETFQILYNKNIDIVFIQETHFIPEASRKERRSGKENLFGTLDQF